MKTMVAAPAARKMVAVKVAAVKADLKVAALKAACFAPVATRNPFMTDRKPSKCIALTATEVASLRLAAKVAGLL